MNEEQINWQLQSQQYWIGIYHQQIQHLQYEIDQLKQFIQQNDQNNKM